MASKGKKTPRDLAVEELTKRSRSKRHTLELWSEFVDEADRIIDGTATQRGAATILILSAAIEQMLESAIATHFTADDATIARMFDDAANGPLTTFAAKIKTGYALGVYSKMMRDELDMIRHIRNLVAHAKEPVDFSTPAIIAGCEQLMSADRFKNIAGWDVDDNPIRQRFIFTARVIFLYLEDTDAPAPMSAKTHPGRGAFEDEP